MDMDEDHERKQQIERAENLVKQRKEILSLPSEEALDRILDARHPAALVQSLFSVYCGKNRSIA